MLASDGATAKHGNIVNSIFNFVYYNIITRGREQIANRTLVRIMGELCCDVELTYKKKQEGKE